LEGYSVKESLQAGIKRHGYKINEKKCNEVLKKLDSGEELAKVSSIEIFNAMFSGLYLKETFDVDEKKIDERIIEMLYNGARSNIKCL
jgi:cell division protein YceG involved in septum cleavage